MRAPLRLRSIIAALAAAGAAASCNATAPDPALAISVPPATLELVQGASVSLTIVISARSIPGDIIFGISGLPAGVTSTFTAASGGNATLSLFAGSVAAPGEVTVSITASAAGVQDAAATFPLHVIVAGGYSLTAPEMISAPRGTSATGTVMIVRAGSFAQDVTLTTGTLPPGVTARFASPVAASASDLTFTIGQTAVVDTVPVTITGTSPGLPNTTVQIQLAILPP